jgi:AraC-like DNA-binding protein
VVPRQRLARAQRLLEASDLPLARSAGERGLANQRYPTRVVTRALGVPPVPRAPCPVPIGGNAPTEHDVNKSVRKDKTPPGSARYPASTRVRRHL